MEEAVKQQFNDNTLSHQKIMDEIKEFKKDFSNFEINMTKLLAEMPLRLQEKFDVRYASKETERIVKKVQWLVISAVVTTLLGTILVDRFFK